MHGGHYDLMRFSLKGKWHPFLIHTLYIIEYQYVAYIIIIKDIYTAQIRKATNAQEVGSFSSSFKADSCFILKKITKNLRDIQRWCWENPKLTHIAAEAS